MDTGQGVSFTGMSEMGRGVSESDEEEQETVGSQKEEGPEE